jgi:maleylpyruvate isomerase
MVVMTSDRELAWDLLSDASGRLLRTVDGFGDGDWAAPSLLPGWTRSHVVAHLVLNAEGMSRALRGVVADAADAGPEEPRSMYDSDEKRHSDIQDLATAEPGEIRDRLMAGTTLLQEAIEAIPDDRWETRVERTPGGRSMRAGAFPGMRLREIEIHHVDLDAGYTIADWSPAFAEQLLDAMTKRLDLPKGVEIRPLDSPRTWVVGDGESEYPLPVVTGPAAEIGWWLTGRPAPDGLSCSHGELPTIESW